MPFGAAEQGSADDAPLTFELQVLRNKDRMTQAQAQGKAREYWVYFEAIMGDMISFMTPDIRAKLEGKYNELLKDIAKIRTDGGVHDDSKQKQIDQLRVAFADENKYYISKSLSRSGIVKVKDEGLVNLEKETIDRYASAIRSNEGVDESLRRMEETEEERMNRINKGVEKHDDAARNKSEENRKQKGNEG